jgi:two-component system, cell cycle sensor histidine kinase and response regulator CckA
METSLTGSVKTPGKTRKALSLLEFLTRLIWLCILPVVLLAIYLAINHVQTLLAQLDENAEHQARNVATAVDRQLGAQIAAMQVLAAAPLVDDPSKLDQFYQEATAFHKGFASHLILADLSMQMLLHTRKPLGATLPKLPRPKGHAAAPTALETGKPAVGDMFFGPLAKEPLVAVAVPVLRAGRTKLLLISIIETRQFQKRLDAVSLPEGRCLAVLDGRGEVMARRSPGGMPDCPGPEGQSKRFVAKSARSPWSVVLEIPASAYREPIVGAMAPLAAAILAATLMGVLGGRMAGRRLAASVAALTQKSPETTSGLVIAEIEAVRKMLADSSAAREAAESTTLESEQRFRLLFNIAPVGLCFVAKDGALINANARLERAFGYSRAEVRTLAEWWQLAYPDPEYRLHAQQTWKAGVLRARQNNTDIEPMEFRITCKNGEVRTVLISGTLIGEDFLAVFFDITERKRAEEALRYHQLLLQEVGRVAKIGGWELDPATGAGTWTEEVAGIHDLDPAEETNFEKGMSFFQGESRSRMERAVREAVELGKPYNLELGIVTAKGAHKWVQSIGNPVVEEGKVVHLRGSLQDITDRKRVEEALRETGDYLRNLVDYASAPIIVWDALFRITIFNAAFERLTGLKADNIIQKSLDFLFPAETRESSMEQIHIASSGERWESVEIPIQQVGGSTRVLLWNSATVYAADGETPVATIAQGVDITERKRAEAALRTSEAQLSNAVRMAHLGPWEYDVAQDLFIFNDHFYEIFRSSAEQVGGYTMSATEYARRFVHPGDRALVAKEIGIALETTDPNLSRQLEHRILYADGETGYISVRFFIVKDDLGRTIKTYGVNQDITDRRIAAKALEESEERYGLVTGLVGHLIYDRDIEAGTIDWSGAIEEITGYTSREFQSIGIAELEELIHPDDRKSVKQSTASSQRTESIRSVVYRLKKKSGPYTVIEDTGAFLYDDSGKAYRMLGVMKDISDRTRAEEEKSLLREQLFQSQKMEAIGTLAGGIAHDFNNLLTVINGYSEMLLADRAPDDSDCGDLTKIRSAGVRGADLVQRLLAFSRKAPSTQRPLDLNRQVQDVSKLLERTIPKMIAVELDLADDLATVLADSTQLEQIIINLAVNAKDAMPDGGRLTISTRNVNKVEELGGPEAEAPPFTHVMLSVSDTGNGIDKDALPHIFEPFYTTKPVGEGTGLGLAMVHGIVKQHGGDVRCYSEPGNGTTFKIYFPALISGEEMEQSGVGPVPKGGGETVLLVDDEEPIRELASRVISRVGYKVLSASNGREALNLYRERGNEIALVVLDLIMPEMGGKQCLEGLLSYDPSVKVVIASGYLSDIPKTDTIAAGAKAFVGKPYDMKQLLATVRAALDEG